MSLKRLSRVFGSVFDVVALSEIPDDDCHVLFVSGRTLYLMQHFGNNEVNFLARYADSFSEDGRYYDSVDLDSANVDLVQRIAQDYRLEVLDMQCTDVIAAIDNLAAQVGLVNISSQGGCGCDGGVLDSEGLDNNTPPDPTDADFLAGKCRVANVIVDRVLYVTRQLDNFGVDDAFGALLGLTTTLVITVLASGPIGWSVALVLGLASGLITIWAALSGTDLGDLETAITANQDDLVNSLYQAASATAAKTAFLAILDGIPLSAALQSLVGFMLPVNVLNELFLPTGTYVDGTDYQNGDYVATDCEATCLAIYVLSDGEGGAGTVTPLGSNQYRLDSGLASDGLHRCGLRVNWLSDGSDCCGDEGQIGYVSGDTVYQATIGCRLFRDDNDPPPADCLTAVTVYSNTNVFGAGPLDFRTVAFRKASAFSVTLEITT